MFLPTLAVEVWWLAQAAPQTGDPATWLTGLGAFAAAAAVGYFGWRDAIKQRDRAIAIIEQHGPVLVEIRDIMRAHPETLRAATEAMEAMAEALKSRIPTEAEVTRLRDALDRAEKLVRSRDGQ
jgi:LPXTG-motif cell wall-anchored protein